MLLVDNARDFAGGRVHGLTSRADGNPATVTRRLQYPSTTDICNGTASPAGYIRQYHVHIYFVAPCAIPTAGTTCDSTADGGKPIPTLKRLELTATARTPSLGTLDDLAGHIGEVRAAAAAAGRTGTIDVLHSYPDRSIQDTALDTDRHREQLAELEQAGVTWTVITCDSRSPAATLEFLEAFGTTFLR